MEFVTDRTAADVAEAIRLIAIGWERMTDSKRNWFIGKNIETLSCLDGELSCLDGELYCVENRGYNKGYYNNVDVNRVESNTKEINDYLNALSDALAQYRAEYHVASDPLFNPNVGYLEIVTKADWAKSDIPTPEDWSRYLSNVVSVTARLPVQAALPATIEGMGYTGANDIEQALQAVYLAGIAIENGKKDLIEKTAAFWLYSGDVYGGEIA